MYTWRITYKAEVVNDRVDGLVTRTGGYSFEMDTDEWMKAYEFATMFVRSVPLNNLSVFSARLVALGLRGQEDDEHESTSVD
jgi:hypothetical protein